MSYFATILKLFGVPTGITLPVLNADLYSLGEEESAFFKSQTGIADDEELKKHILTVQDKAYKVYPYPCIRRFAFTKLKISRHPAYQQFLQLGKTCERGVFLDIGCCVGNDARKAIADGYPMRNVIASDLRPEFWNLGHELFKSTPQTFPVPFIPGNALESTLIGSTEPRYSPPSSPAPELSSLTSLTPLLGRVSAIHASAFFHVFNEAEQFQVAQRLGALLSTEPGSVIFGSHEGRPESGTREYIPGVRMFCHSPESWRELWEERIFKKGSVKVDAQLEQVARSDLSSTSEVHYLLVWSVTRL
ncbi:hypothetical protein OE88DRAFT_1712763 [Heliocybe sulcata]|uniref:Methyltransferase domain-containing protein n=1 Tax=Heliocybe sulcata TaxID=5364 RepID=A0A5C3N0Z2_9AGAM|nr:hypothetical protein OE88DRAFT_1712763 [Heliocybe sulcata]